MPIDLSIVSTLYCSSNHLEEFVERITAAAQALSLKYELILVNDGSPDDSLELAKRFQEADSAIRVVDLSRNFGHHRAVMAGLEHASGERVFLIDCDLEEPPEVIHEFVSNSDAKPDIDVFFGVQEKRKGGWVERTGGELFYWLMNRLTNLNFPSSALTVRLMSRRYVDALLLHREESVFLAGLFEVTGFEQEMIPVRKGSREGTSYGFIGRLSLLVTGVTSFSPFPLLLSFYLGSAISLISLMTAIYFFVRKLLVPEMIIEGWASVMISIWFLSGAVLVSTGLIGLYLSRVYIEVKRRPNYIVRARYGFETNPSIGETS
jgi:putative glycosyltransferase